MDLYNYITKRKSTRKYDETPLTAVQLTQIGAFADSLKPLYPDIKTAYEITHGVKIIQPINAPHYFVISSEDSDGYLENVGFMFQQIDLYLSSLGLGSCWLGMAKPPAELKSKLPFVIAIAFGNAKSSPYREPSEYKRKPLSDISKGSDERLEAARLAPSAMNNQNWFFASAHGKIDVYYKKTMLSDKKNKLDIGIALCHLAVATEHFGGMFSFGEEEGKTQKGYVYVGTVYQTKTPKGDE